MVWDDIEKSFDIVEYPVHLDLGQTIIYMGTESSAIAWLKNEVNNQNY